MVSTRGISSLAIRPAHRGKSLRRLLFWTVAVVFAFAMLRGRSSDGAPWGGRKEGGRGRFDLGLRGGRRGPGAGGVKPKMARFLPKGAAPDPRRRERAQRRRPVTRGRGRRRWDAARPRNRGGSDGPAGLRWHPPGPVTSDSWWSEEEEEESSEVEPSEPHPRGEISDEDTVDGEEGEGEEEDDDE